MEKTKNFPPLRRVILSLILYRVFLPLLILDIIAIIAAGYLGEKNLGIQQKKSAQSIVHMVDYHLDHGGRILDAVARTADTSGINDLSVFMKSTWISYGYFDTMYYLDKSGKIKIQYPYDPRYEGLDLSNLPDFKKADKNKNLVISSPFISLRTGEPTVYLIRPLSYGGCIVGELNLGLFQEEITDMTNKSNKDLIFIMDQSGTLLAHPSSELVRQQTNLSNLGIFQNNLDEKGNSIYFYNGARVLGASACVKRTGWIVVDQVPISVFLGNYAWTIILIVIASLIIWLTLLWNLRKQLNRFVIAPLEQLNKETEAMAIGSYSRASSLSVIPVIFSELKELANNFQFMGKSLETREIALIESEDRYRGLFNRVPIGLFRITLNREIIDVNPAVINILKYPDYETLLKVNTNELFSSAFNKEEQEKFAAGKAGDLKNFEAQVKRYDGIFIWVRINIQAAHDSEEQKLYYEGSIEDITERIEIEKKISEQQELLLEAEKKQREELEKSLVMKDEFISLISHEFKTPLNVIYSAIQLIECIYFKQIPERVKELIGNIKQNTFRQLRLANNLLDITRLNAGQYKLNMRNIDIVFLTKAITQSVKLYANQKKIKLSYRSYLKNKTINIDDEKYERIILNLLSNAIKFTDEGGRISVILNEDKESDTIVVKVKDTGIGIPKDKQELIFERFGQVDSNLSRRAEGTGIGLSLVKLLVNILGGKIELESEMGVGSTFVVMLPAKKVEIESECEVCADTEDRLVSEIKVQLSDIYF